MTDDIKFRHDIRDDLRDVVEEHELTKQCDGSWANDDLLIELVAERIDFQAGDLVADVRVETPDCQVAMTARRIHSFGLGVRLEGYHDGQRVSVYA